jgi:hypothetical protein
MKIILIFLIAFFVIDNQYGYAEAKNTLTVNYFDNYDAPYELEIDSDQSYLLSQSYSWVRDQSSRYNLIGYSVDGSDIIEISRKSRGNFTFDVAMDVPHSIVFLQFHSFLYWSRAYRITRLVQNPQPMITGLIQTRQ